MFNRKDAKLLQELTWHTQVILGDEELSDPDLSVFQRTVAEVENELSGNSEDIKAARHILKISSPGGRAPKTISPLNMYKAVNRVLAYRILDVCQWAKTGNTSIGAHFTDTPTVDYSKILVELGLPVMQDWTSVIQGKMALLESLEKCLEEGEPIPAENDSMARRLFRSICARSRDNKAAKMISNFEVAAMELSIHLQGHWDIVGSPWEATIREHQSLLALDNRLSSMRLPLSLALTLSPIALFHTKVLWKCSVSNKHLLHTFQVYGGRKPPIILEIEQELWRAIVDIAKGTAQTLPRLCQALQYLQGLMTEREAKLYPEWFLSPTLPQLAQMNVDSEGLPEAPALGGLNPKLPHSPARSDHRGDTAEASEISIDGERAGDRPTRCPQGPGMGPDLERSRSHRTRRKQGSSADDSSLGSNLDATPDREDDSSSESSGASLSDSDSEAPQGFKGAHSPRPRRSGRIKDQAPKGQQKAPNAKAAKTPRRKPSNTKSKGRGKGGQNAALRHSSKTLLGSSKTYMRITRISDLSKRSEKRPAIPLATAPIGQQKHAGARAIILMSPSKQPMDYLPASHVPKELESVYGLADLVRTVWEDIDEMAHPQFATLPAAQISTAKHLVITSVPFKTYRFDTAGLSSVFPDASSLTFIETTHEERRRVRGKIEQLVQSATNSTGHIIGTERFQMPNSDYPPPSNLASDIQAWALTSGGLYCERRLSYPEMYTRWAAATTRHMLEAWIVERDGFTVYVNVVAGSIWVMVAKPKAFEQHSFDAIKARSHDFDPSESWNLEAVRLTPQSRLILHPNTPYRILTIENAITTGGSFYRFHTITPSCLGILQTFICGPNVSDKEHSSALMILGRMVIYLHQKWVVEGVQDAAQLPDLTTLEGIFQVLSLTNVAELAKVLHMDTYTQFGIMPHERVRLIHIRKQARILVRWLESHYEIRRPSDNARLSAAYLLHQAYALQDAKQFVDENRLKSPIPGLTQPSLNAELTACVQGMVDVGARERLESFAFPDQSFSVSKRAEPLRFTTEDITGETEDDVIWKQDFLNGGTPAHMG